MAMLSFSFRFRPRTIAGKAKAAPAEARVRPKLAAIQGTAVVNAGEMDIREASDSIGLKVSGHVVAPDSGSTPRWGVSGGFRKCRPIFLTDECARHELTADEGSLYNGGVSQETRPKSRESSDHAVIRTGWTRTRRRRGSTSTTRSTAPSPRSARDRRSRAGSSASARRPGTIAKSISAYDMTVSDAIYGAVRPVRQPRSAWRRCSTTSTGS